jgi:hypothetical protein
VARSVAISGRMARRRARRSTRSGSANVWDAVRWRVPVPGWFMRF